jgi:hypothetical protein
LFCSLNSNYAASMFQAGLRSRGIFKGYLRPGSARKHDRLKEQI